MRSSPPRRTRPSLTRCSRRRSATRLASASRAVAVSLLSCPVCRSPAIAWPSRGGKRWISVSTSSSRSARRRLSDFGSRRRASRFSACIRSCGQAPAGAAVRRTSPVSRKARITALLDDLGLQGDLAVLGLESEVHGLRSLVGEDAGGLLADELLEAVELHGGGLARLLARGQEAVVQGAPGLGVPLRVLGPVAGGSGSRGVGGPGRRGGSRGHRRGQRVGLEPVHPEGLALLARAQLLAPELVERVVLRGQGLVSEALGVVADLRVRVAA